ncbi:MAG: helix-turn-helix transcriptional regulator [Candidatus Acidiferrales bacterium]|jgi:transcriptional regulator with XRE-family HTH domain
MRTSKPTQTARSQRGLGRRLFDFRLRRNVSLRDAAKAIEMDPTALSRIERGLRQPGRMTAAKIREFMKRRQA